MTAGISVTELVSWGTLVYAFSAFVVPMRAELGWSPAVFTSVYTAASLVSGLVAVPVGRVLARRSPHAVMLAGAVLACFGLVAWSQVAAVWSFAAALALVGVAMAMTLYEPAFVLTARWFDDRTRPRAVAAVTMVAGLAATVFVPLSGALTGALGWRTALLVLAAVEAILAVPVHLVLLRVDRTAAPTPTARAGPSSDPRARARRRRSLPWIVVSLAAAAALKYGVVVLLVAFLVATGHSLRAATLLAGLVGVLQVVGRFATAAAASRWPEQHVTVALFAVQAVSLGALPALAGPGPGATAATALAVAGFGLGLGAGQAELLRGTLLVTLYGARDYPRVNGLVSGFVVVARGAGPFALGLLVTATSSYTAALLAAAALALLAAAALPAGLHRYHRDDQRPHEHAYR